MIFAHDGKFGDLIASLSLIQTMGGGSLILRPTNPVAHDRWNEEMVKPIVPLLEAQDYISGVSFSREALPREALDLGQWRSHYKNAYNLCDNYYSWLGKPHPDRHLPWLGVGADYRAKVIFARSGRYHGSFPWVRAVKKYKGHSLFLGLPDEHKAFERQYGDVPYCPTSDFLEAARIIKGACLVCVNQTALYWIAEGLKVPVCLEAAGRQWDRNCHWERLGFFYGSSEYAELPDLEVLDQLYCELQDKVREAISSDVQQQASM